MSIISIIKKLKAYEKRPDLYQEPSSSEFVQLALLVLRALEQIQEEIKQGKLKGETPKPDVEYLSKNSALQMLNDAWQTLESKVKEDITKKLNTLQDGKDAEITEDIIKKIASEVLKELELPDFDEIVVKNITKNPQAVRDALELLQEQEQLDAKFIKGWEQEINKIKNQVSSIVARRLGNIRDVDTEGVQNGQTLVYQNGVWTVGNPSGGISFAYVAEVPTGTVNGVNTSFTLSQTPMTNSAILQVNGQVQRLGTDYTVTGTALEMLWTPQTGDTLFIYYTYET